MAKEVFPFGNGKPCPECAAPEAGKNIQEYIDGYGWAHSAEYSCVHFKDRIESSPCKYCGKKDTPVRQVPAPCPVSDCYCDDCREKCRAEYMAMLDERRE